jgi:serine/threonine protein kinase
VAYWLLTGRAVFNRPNPIQLMYQHANATPVPPSEFSELEIPPALDQVILACLAKDPDDRPQSARELSYRLPTAGPGGGWTEVQAQKWWERHHPASGPRESPDAANRMLTKKVDVTSESAETGASALASTTLTQTGSAPGT